jgi:hypothetical protein
MDVSALLGGSRRKIIINNEEVRTQSPANSNMMVGSLSLSTMAVFIIPLLKYLIHNQHAGFEY